jgi:hypothetical protein
MSQREDRYGRNDLPSNTAEFRAAPDASASTAEFRAFAAGQVAGTGRTNQGLDAWPEQPWAGEAPARKSGLTAGIVIGAVIVVALVVILVVLLG